MSIDGGGNNTWVVSGVAYGALERQTVEYYVPTRSWTRAQLERMVAQQRESGAVSRPCVPPRLPVVLYVHGGAWVSGASTAAPTHHVCKMLARRGFLTVSVDYRLCRLHSSLEFSALTAGLAAFCCAWLHLRGDRMSLLLKALWIVLAIFFVVCFFLLQILSSRSTEKQRHPTQLADVHAAFRHVRENVHRYGGDPDSIALVGHSAGGHLVTALTTHPDYLVDERDVAAVRCVVSLSGVYSAREAAESWPLRIAALNVFGRDTDAWKDAMPLDLLRKHRRPQPPILLLTAEFDFGLRRHALRFLAELRGQGQRSRMVTVADADHFSVAHDLDAQHRPVLALVAAFLRSHRRRSAA